jgi:hypothetical protein
MWWVWWMWWVIRLIELSNHLLKAFFCSGSTELRRILMKSSVSRCGIFTKLNIFTSRQIQAIWSVFQTKFHYKQPFVDPPCVSNFFNSDDIPQQIFLFLISDKLLSSKLLHSYSFFIRLPINIPSINPHFIPPKLLYFPTLLIDPTILISSPLKNPECKTKNLLR